MFLKHQVNWNIVCGAVQDLPWHNICLADNPVEVLNEHLSLLVVRYIPTKFLRVRNNDKPWFDDQCRHALCLTQEAHLRWTRDWYRVNWKEFFCCQVRANETYSEATRQFGDRKRAVLVNIQSPRGGCLRLLVRVVDWRVSLLVKLICCLIILTASSLMNLLICRSLAICLQVSPPLPSGRKT